MFADEIGMYPPLKPGYALLLVYVFLSTKSAF